MNNDLVATEGSFVMPQSSEERFWAKVEVAPGCWLWRATTNRSGYGMFWNGKRLVPAHRWSYEQFVGPIPAGLQLDHLCRVRNCVNPKHLEPVTGKENVHRGTSFAAVNALKTHCKQGHEFSPENTYIPKSMKGRFCRKCRQIMNRAYEKRVREAKAAELKARIQELEAHSEAETGASAS